MRPKASYLVRSSVIALALLGVASGAFAQLHQDCTVSVLNRNVQVNPDGSWVLPNVPANFGQVRARATCVQNGITTSGESAFFTLPANGVVNLPDVVLGSVTPIPVSLRITPGSVSLSTVGQTSQLAVTATYSDGSTQDITAATTGTTYTTSNPALVTVSAAGLLTAVASGTVVVQATHEGAAGLIMATVALSSTDTDGDGIPDDVELALGLNPNNPIDAQEDFDRDGLTNLQEVQLGTNILLADSDSDGLTDGQEVTRGTNALLGDTDGDGIRDGLEVQTGSNPLDPTSFNLAQALASLDVTPSNLVITVNTLLGEASRQLTVTGRLRDATSIDLTSPGRGTTYASSNVTVCNFGGQAGRVFGGAAGACTVTASNNGFSAAVNVIVRTFTPRAITSITIPGYANNVDVIGDDFAYVAAGAQGLQIVNVSNLEGIGNLPPNRIVGVLDTPGTAIDVKVVGNLAYIADGSAGLQIVNVAAPTAPSLVGTADTPGIAQDIVVASANRAYLADGASGLAIVDISVPSSPQVLRSVDVQGTAKGVDITDARTHAVVAVGSPSASVVKVIDITNESHPQVVGSVPIPGDAKDLVIRDNYAYVAAFTGGLQVVDISTPSTPLIVGAIPQSGGFVPRDVALSGAFALAAEQLFPNAIPLVDISAPTAPNFLSTIDLSPLGDYAGTGIALTQQFAYVTEERFVVGQDFNATGDTRLFIAQYLAIEDNEGIPPTISITFPTPGADVIEGSTIQVTANATDDIAVAAVNFLVDGAIVSTDSSALYQATLVVPVGLASLTLGAQAVDFGSNVTTTPNLIVRVIPTPPPTVAITSPAEGETLIEGEVIVLSADATDDGQVVSVLFTANGVDLPLDTITPFSTPFTVPLGVVNLTIEATATDDAGKTATDSRTVNVIPDPGTTVAGRVLDINGNPVANAAVTCLGVSGLSSVDGRFSIAQVPTIQGDIQCTVTFTTPDGRLLTGVISGISPVLNGVTEVGDTTAIEAQFETELGPLVVRCDDCFVSFTLPFPFPFFGQTRTTVFVNNNGNLTFTFGESDFTETIAEFARQPRISAFWDDIISNIPESGLFVNDQLPGKFVVTWFRQQKFCCFGEDTVQVILFRDGRIQFGYNGVTTPEAIVGITPGGDLPLRQEDYSATRSFTITGPTTSLEQFTNTRPFDLDRGFILWAPNASNGYDVRVILP